jgi:DNA-binding transcriptional ArsR family regulator
MTDQTLARAFAALADPTRRAVFERVADRPQAVGELADQLPVSRPAVSQHLKVLSEAGLVVARAQGTSRIYELDPRGLEGLRDYLDGFWNRSLRSFRRYAEQQHRPITQQEQR